MRTKSISDFVKAVFMLMNNSVFGKTEENLPNRVNVEVVTKREIALKRVCKPAFKRSMTIHEDLVIMQNTVSNLVLNKPVYVGFSVLKLSKMCEFHYEKMLKQYDNINLCFTDTDSLLYDIIYPFVATEEERVRQSIYLDMAEHVDDYDFSAYSKDHPLFSNMNKKVIGKFKDELNGRPLEEFIGVLPKCYILLFHGEVKDTKVVHERLVEKQTAKGTTKSVKKRYLRHKHYKNTLQKLDTLIVRQNIIKSRNHGLGSYH